MPKTAGQIATDAQEDIEASIQTLSQLAELFTTINQLAQEDDRHAGIILMRIERLSGLGQFVAQGWEETMHCMLRGYQEVVEGSEASSTRCVSDDLVTAARASVARDAERVREPEHA